MKKYDDFFTPETDSVEKKYLPDDGEGNNMATQAVTATVKLVYKWFNDGDVYDNRYGLRGWANDLSSYANWLYNNIPETEDILMKIKRISSEDEYQDLLYDLMSTVMTFSLTDKYKDKPAVGSIYNEEGPFEFLEEDDYWE